MISSFCIYILDNNYMIVVNEPFHDQKIDVVIVTLTHVYVFIICFSLGWGFGGMLPTQGLLGSSGVGRRGGRVGQQQQISKGGKESEMKTEMTDVGEGGQSTGEGGALTTTDQGQGGALSPFTALLNRPVSCRVDVIEVSHKHAHTHT
jgi:hypothetical protein